MLNFDRNAIGEAQSQFNYEYGNHALLLLAGSSNGGVDVLPMESYQPVSGYQLDYDYNGFVNDQIATGSTTFSIRKSRSFQQLPECNLSNLELINEILNSATIHSCQRDEYAAAILDKDGDYLRRLLTLFSDLEGQNSH